MTAWAFTIAYNEAAIIRYWVRHYATFCERVVVYCDVGSTDNTAEIAWLEGAEVRPYGPSGLDDVAFVAFAEQQYKEARDQADWVIWTDADEILYHDRLAERLAELKAAGVNFPTTTGYSMMADTLPTGAGQIYEYVKHGFRAPAYAKACIFDPDLDVKWQTGKHEAQAEGMVRDDGQDSLKLLHYRWLGESYFLQRNERNFSRLNELNRAHRHGVETYPGYVGDYSPAWYRERRTAASECV